MNTRSRAHRILRQLPSYTSFENGRGNSSEFLSIALGHPVGEYENSERNPKHIHIFDNGLRYEVDGVVTEFQFSDVISSTLGPEMSIKKVFIKLRDGSELALPIDGQDGKFLDSTSFIRFVDRAVEDALKARGVR